MCSLILAILSWSGNLVPDLGSGQAGTSRVWDHLTPAKQLKPAVFFVCLCFVFSCIWFTEAFH